MRKSSIRRHTNIIQEQAMLVYPSVEKVARGRRGMLAGIEACMARQCLVSAVSLIYATIDALAALTRPLGATRSTRAEYKAWVERYMIPSLREPLTADDLYAARCGILHAYSAESEASRAGEAKAIVYKWRDGHRPDDARLAELSRTATVIEIQSLHEALETAVMHFEAHIRSDPSLEARVAQHVSELLCYEPWSPVGIWVAA
jgi:hypothetical protein